MAKKRQTQKRDKRRARRTQIETHESRTADAVTVAWMLTALATLAAELFALLGWIAVAVAARSGQVPREFVMLPVLLTFIALVTGLVCLLLIPVTHRVRNTPPPRSVTIFAAVVGIMPSIVVLVTFLLKD